MKLIRLQKFSIMSTDTDRVTRARIIFPPFNLASGIPLRFRRLLNFQDTSRAGLLRLHTHELEVNDGVNSDDDVDQENHDSPTVASPPTIASITLPVERPQTRSVTRSTIAAASAPSKKSLRSKAYSRAHRTRASAARDHRLPMYHYHSNTGLGMKYRDAAKAAFTIHAQDLPHNEAGAFTGKVEKSSAKDRRIWTFRMLKQNRFQIIPWDGRYVVLFLH